MSLCEKVNIGVHTAYAKAYIFKLSLRKKIIILTATEI